MVTLDPFQEETVNEAVNAYPTRKYKPLFQGTGVGKTMQYAKIAEQIGLRVERETGKRPVTWLVTIKAAKESQVEKIQMTDARLSGLQDIVVLDGDVLTRQIQLGMVMAYRPRWFVLNYDQLRLHAAELTQIMDPDTDILILDEVDLIQNGTSDRSVVATALACLAHYRIIATASAVKNKVDSLYAPLRACDPTNIHREELQINGEDVTLPVPRESQFWGSEGAFLSKYAFVDANGRIVGTRNVPELHRRLEGFGASIIDADEVLNIHVDAPDFRNIELYPEARAIYRMVKQGILEWADDNERAFTRGDNRDRSKLKLKLLAQINYARRISVLSPQNFLRLVKINLAKKMKANKLDDEGLLERLNLEKMSEYVGGNAKVDAAIEYVRSFHPDPQGGGGLAVYSEWTDVLTEFETCLNGDRERLGFGRITGDVSDAERQRVRHAVADGSIHLVAISDAGGRSIDLQGLNRLIVLTPSWTHTQIQQAFGRVARRGQTLPVQIIYLTAENTIESKRLMPILSQKAKDSDRILYGERGKRNSPLMGIDSLYEVGAWL